MAKKILIIEDDPFLGDVLVQKLSKEGFDILLSKDGKEGLERIKSVHPDLVLLDIILPSMNGYEILEEKQKDSAIKEVPVIIISNSGQPVEINRALALGVKDYLVKAQFDPEDVLTKVRDQFRKQEDRSQTTSKVSNDHSLDGKKIMWIEDDKFLNDIIARKLSSTKCQFIHASDGEEAMQKIAKEKPDVILLDIILVGMDGFEILKRIKADPEIKNIPVILLSNLSQSADIEKGKALGAARFLVKATVTLDEIIDDIKAVIFDNQK